VDQLWPAIASRLTGSPVVGNDDLLRCNHSGCHADRKGQIGFWKEQQGQPVGAKSIRTVVGTHVGIDRLTQSAAESILYTLQGLDGELVGSWQGREESLETLSQLLERSQWEVRVGHHRTRGYGRVRLHLEEVIPDDLPSRWEGWNDAFLAWTGKGEADTFTFTVTLPGGAILLDPTLRYSLDPAEMVTWLPPLPGVAEQSQVVDTTAGRAAFGGRLWCLCAFARHERVRGWQAAHGLPRQDEYAVSRGAVYAYHFEGPEAGKQGLLAALQRLQGEGIGARRVEGFGRIMISDAFHQLCAPEKA
jgi:hypothetical protein